MANFFGCGFARVAVKLSILGPVVRKPINANPRLIAYEGVYFSTPKCGSTLIFGKNLH